MLAGERAGRERRDKLARRGGEDRPHREAALLETANEIERLVGRDPAADDQENAASVRPGGRRELWLLPVGGGPRRGFDGRGAQDGADLVLHRTAVTRG